MGCRALIGRPFFAAPMAYAPQGRPPRERVPGGGACHESRADDARGRTPFAVPVERGPGPRPRRGARAALVGRASSAKPAIRTPCQCARPRLRPGRTDRNSSRTPRATSEVREWSKTVCVARGGITHCVAASGTVLARPLSAQHGRPGAIRKAAPSGGEPGGRVHRRARLPMSVRCGARPPRRSGRAASARPAARDRSAPASCAPARAVAARCSTPPAGTR